MNDEVLAGSSLAVHKRGKKTTLEGIGRGVQNKAGIVSAIFALKKIQMCSSDPSTPQQTEQS